VLHAVSCLLDCLPELSAEDNPSSKMYALLQYVVIVLTY